MVANLDNTLPQTKPGREEGSPAGQELAGLSGKVWGGCEETSGRDWRKTESPSPGERRRREKRSSDRRHKSAARRRRRAGGAGKGSGDLESGAGIRGPDGTRAGAPRGRDSALLPRRAPASRPGRPAPAAVPPPLPSPGPPRRPRSPLQAGAARAGAPRSGHAAGLRPRPRRLTPAGPAGAAAAAAGERRVRPGPGPPRALPPAPPRLPAALIARRPPPPPLRAGPAAPAAPPAPLSRLRGGSRRLARPARYLAPRCTAGAARSGRCSCAS